MWHLSPSYIYASEKQTASLKIDSCTDIKTLVKGRTHNHIMRISRKHTFPQCLLWYVNSITLDLHLSVSSSISQFIIQTIAGIICLHNHLLIPYYLSSFLSIYIQYIFICLPVFPVHLLSLSSRLADTRFSHVTSGSQSADNCTKHPGLCSGSSPLIPAWAPTHFNPRTTSRRRKWARVSWGR